MFGKIKKVHFIGIGGIGMSGIAELLVHWGFKITGSDLVQSENTLRLEKMGVKIHYGHKEENLDKCDVVVYSSAIKPGNPELQAAKKKHIPIMRRAEMLGELLKLKPVSIAIAGTHGKTTTTSMIGKIFTAAKFDPIIIVGGVVRSLGSPTRPGSGNYIIVEADEFDRSFLKLNPTNAIITTIEAEHLDCYTSLDDIEKAFTQFANSVPFYGSITICLDEPANRRIIQNFEKPVFTYGLSPDADLYANSIFLKENTSRYKVYSTNGKTIGNFRLNVPGIHNIKNSLAAISVALQYDIHMKTIKSALEEFTGVHRRFEITYKDNKVVVVDDYAHHPSEIKATLYAAKTGWNRRIISIFQPHLYSRTRDFYKEFAEALTLSDIAIVLDVYPAREEPIDGVTGKLIFDALKGYGHQKVHYVEDREILPELITKMIQKNDMIITLGAGDVWKINNKLVERLSKD
ncbi:MAG: UDP-N-acetylmuramate--L-alanine ligase [Candidatus Marinimicrobia bacterium]|nr:UDP-N-acetylmuramate--L-alanine ligase [Candidatus Neomarinimicrobiota bacterium]